MTLSNQQPTKRNGRTLIINDSKWPTTSCTLVRKAIQPKKRELQITKNVRDHRKCSRRFVWMSRNATSQNMGGICINDRWEIRIFPRAYRWKTIVSRGLSRVCEASDCRRWFPKATRAYHVKFLKISHRRVDIDRKFSFTQQRDFHWWGVLDGKFTQRSFVLMEFGVIDS